MYFSRVELKRLCEIFTRMFADPHSKVRSQRLAHSLDLACVYVLRCSKMNILYFYPCHLLGKTGIYKFEFFSVLL